MRCTRCWIRRRLRRLRAHSDRGNAPAEAVIIFLVVVVVSLTVVQGAMVWFARSQAHAAAAQAVSIASAYQQATSTGQDSAQQYMQQVASGLVSGVQVSANSDGTTVTIRVQGHVTSIVPLLDFTVDESAMAPIEALSPAGTP